MNRLLLLLCMLAMTMTVSAQTDTTFYTSAKGKISNDNQSEVAYYELNNGFNRNGPVKQYYPDHILYGEVNYLNNQLTGDYKKYYRNGQLKEAGTFKEGVVYRTVTRWYQNGQKHSELEFSREKSERITRRTTSGSAISSKLINAWDSVGNQQVSNATGYLNSPVFSNSKYWEKGEYVNGKKVGNWSGTKSGDKDYEETYDQDGELISGVSYNDDGSKNEYTVLEAAPSYPGGPKKWARFLQNNLKYPKVARKAEVEGSVFMTFVVDRMGLVSNIEVVAGIGSGCDEEAVRVLEKSKQWIPGIQRGKAVKRRIALQLVFKLR